jgi:leucyl-tRNA synthetase
LQNQNIGEAFEQFRLHDWLISRQRYWGAPIPIIYCDTCGTVPVPEEHLPVTLPEKVAFSDTYGEDISPLATVSEFVNTACPKCNQPAKRDTDTMDTFVCSSWYYLRYPNAKIETGPFDASKLDWLPVDTYVGGSEHATMHLLYARFITKALRDLGYLNFDEPFTKLFHQGTITKDGAKMSKSKSNTVSPDKFVEMYGSDTFRAYLMFMGPFDEGGDWNDKGITGIYRFLNKAWKFGVTSNNSDNPNAKDLQVLHKTIHAVSKDLSQMKFNTAISRLMEFLNYFNKRTTVQKELQIEFIKLLAPIAPHLSEELWEYNEGRGSVFLESFPVFDESLAEEDTVTIAVQVNGKLRGNIEVVKNITKDQLLIKARTQENVCIHLKNKDIVNEIVVPQRLVNFVVK